MFRVPLLVAIALATAFGGGIYVTQYAVRYSTGFGAISLGVWQAFPKAQSADADPYAKNHRAKAGRLLLASAEGLVFSSLVDDTGSTLNPTCDYEISGQTPPARYWVLYAADDDNAPLELAKGLPGALNSDIALYQPDGSFRVTLSAKAQPGNWIAVPPQASFKLVLTLLDTPAAGSSGLVGLSMPAITKLECRDA